MSFFRTLIISGFLQFLAIVGFFLGGYWWLVDAAQSPELARPAVITVQQGMHTGEMAALLKKSGIVKSAFLFRFWCSFYGIGSRLRPGTYRFQGGESLDQVFQMFLEGREEKVRVTIPEGWTLPMIAAGVEHAGICSSAVFLQTITSPDLIKQTFIGWGTLPSAEGLAFPETYTFARGVSAKEVADSMLQKSFDIISRRIASATADGLTPYQACILASLVEREGKLAEERPIIASVFLNRLRQGMRLESCATVQYALPEHKERLTFDDLKIESPYNTYLHSGLPPTPISNFGKASIDAVISPARTDYLFFVSNASEGHRFANTLNEHERYRQRFFQDRRLTQNSPTASASLEHNSDKGSDQNSPSKSPSEHKRKDKISRNSTKNPITAESNDSLNAPPKILIDGVPDIEQTSGQSNAGANDPKKGKTRRRGNRKQ
ncbi:MAG: endolytic transglycosylase MltG [Candidatus Riflebacteria bacterium]|nr:endolytic transglycosylase MltG [Candidatus Riflebacteria bacterium]